MGWWELYSKEGARNIPSVGGELVTWQPTRSPLAKEEGDGLKRNLNTGISNDMRSPISPRSSGGKCQLEENLPENEANTEESRVRMQGMIYS